MSIYRHHVVGFFSHRSKAEKIFSYLISHTLSHKFIRIFDKYSVLPSTIIKENSLANRGDAFASGAVASLAGTGLSTLLDIKLNASEVSLIVEGALIPQLVVLGWGPSLGVESEFDAGNDTKMLSDLVHDAILSRQIVVVVETSSEEETLKASDAIQASLNDLSSVS